MSLVCMYVYVCMYQHLLVIDNVYQNMLVRFQWSIYIPKGFSVLYSRLRLLLQGNEYCMSY